MFETSKDENVVRLELQRGEYYETKFKKYKGVRRADYTGPYKALQKLWRLPERNREPLQGFNRVT